MVSPNSVELQMLHSLCLVKVHRELRTMSEIAWASWLRASPLVTWLREARERVEGSQAPVSVIGEKSASTEDAILDFA